jgi:hypothetical protein
MYRLVGRDAKTPTAVAVTPPLPPFVAAAAREMSVKLQVLRPEIQRAKALYAHDLCT